MSNKDNSELDNLPESVKRLIKANYRVFSTSDGKILLDEWIKRYCMTSKGGPAKTNEEIRYQAAKADFVLDILESIELAKKL